MSDETSRPQDEPIEPAKPAKPADPARPADPIESDAEDAAAPVAPEPSEPAVPTPAPEPTSAPPAAPFPPASPYEPAPQQPTPSPYEAPASQPQYPYGAPAPQQPPSPYGGYAPQQPYPAAPAPGTPGSGKALASLVCGICAIVFSGTVVVSIILGVVAIVLASQYVKSFGKDGKATGGKVCGIVGIAFSVFALVSYLMLGALTFFAISEYDGPTYSSSSPLSETPLPDASDDAAVQAAAEQTLNKLTSPDQALLASLAEKADDAFKDSSDFTLAEVGVDPVEFAQWLMEGTSYVIEEGDAYAYSDGTASAFATTQSRSFYAVNDALYDDVTAYVEQSGGFSSEAEYQAKLAELLPAAMEKAAGQTEESYIMLDFEKKGDTWTLDEDSFENALEQMYELW